LVAADKNGVVQEKLSYDAWGKRRNLNGTAISLSVLNAFKPKFSQKGFTNHKHVDSVGLIHMNGRVYDPITARFLSADPIIQSPSNMQSLNRYSYVMNNPLSYTDPSGYGWLSKKWKQIRRVAIAAVAYVACGPICASMAMSARRTLDHGGSWKDAFKSAAIAGVTAVAFSGAGKLYDGAISNYGITSKLGQVATKAVIHGVTGCATASLGGGSCGDGFTVSAIAGAYTVATNGGFASMLGESLGESAGNFAGLLEVSTLGGLTSEAVGGNFSDGFESAASGYAFNSLDLFFKSAVVAGLVLKYKDPLMRIVRGLNKIDRQSDKLDSDVGQTSKKAGSAGINRTGKDFTPKTKQEIDAENSAKNGGINRCENCGIEVVPGQKSERGVTPPGNERQRDHIIPKSQGGDGTLENGQILCRTCNLEKGDSP